MLSEMDVPYKYNLGQYVHTQNVRINKDYKDNNKEKDKYKHMDIARRLSLNGSQCWLQSVDNQTSQGTADTYDTSCQTTNKK